MSGNLSVAEENVKVATLLEVTSTTNLADFIATTEEFIPPWGDKADQAQKEEWLNSLDIL